MSKNADLCVLPVNDASKLLGDGAKYKMLGAVTHRRFQAEVCVAQPSACRRFGYNEIVEIRPDACHFGTAVAASSQWLLKDEVTSETILNAIRSHYPDPENTAPAFNNLTKETTKLSRVRSRELPTAVQNAPSPR